MTDDDIQSVMTYVDALTQARIALVNSQNERGWQIHREKVEQCRRNLIARLKEI